MDFFTKHKEAFALRLCELPGPRAEAAFKALAENRKIATPSDRVMAVFAMYCQDERLSWSERDELQRFLFATEF